MKKFKKRLINKKLTNKKFYKKFTKIKKIKYISKK